MTMTDEPGFKVLTVRQPWAWAILFAGKDIDNRSRSTDYRGPLMIHAAVKRCSDATLLPGVRRPTKR